MPDDDVDLLIPVEDYLSAGVHIGTQQKTKDMERFIHRVRDDGLYVLDVSTTDQRIRTAADFLKNYNPEQILVTSSRQYGRFPAEKFADAIGARARTGTLYPRHADEPRLRRLHRAGCRRGHGPDRGRTGRQGGHHCRHPGHRDVRLQQPAIERRSGYPDEQQGSTRCRSSTGCSPTRRSTAAAPTLCSPSTTSRTNCKSVFDVEFDFCERSELCPSGGARTTPRAKRAIVAAVYRRSIVSG